MKTIIAGSRSITSLGHVQDAMNLADDQGIYVTEVVSGTAPGVDRLGEKWAGLYKLPIKQFPAQWDTFGKRAGFLRNEDMARYADALVAIWDGQSRGTNHMIQAATTAGLKICVHTVRS